MSKKFATMDGNEAAAYVSYAFTEVAGVYPITPSSQMGDNTEKWATQGKKNLLVLQLKLLRCSLKLEQQGHFMVHSKLEH